MPDFKPHYKSMCNDIRKLIAVYIVSIPIERMLSGSTEPVADFTLDLINDIFTLLVYYEIVQNCEYMQRGDTMQGIIKGAVMFAVNDYLTNRTVNLVKMAGAIGLGISFKYISEAFKAKNIDISKIEDSLQTVIVLSLANNSIPDTVAKSISLLLFHSFLKW